MLTLECPDNVRTASTAFAMFRSYYPDIEFDMSSNRYRLKKGRVSFSFSKAGHGEWKLMFYGLNVYDRAISSSGLSSSELSGIEGTWRLLHLAVREVSRDHSDLTDKLLAIANRAKATAERKLQNVQRATEWIQELRENPESIDAECIMNIQAILRV
jgi:hypothetical protein